VIDYTHGHRLFRPWLPSQCTIDDETGFLADGVSTWGIIQPYAGRTNALHFVVCYSPVTSPVSRPEFRRIRIDEVFCRIFDASVDFGISGVNFDGSMEAPGLAQSGDGGIVSSGTIQLPVPSVATITPQTTALGNYNAFITAIGGLTTGPVPVAAPLQETTTIPSFGVFGTSASMATLDNSTVSGLNFDPSVGFLSASGTAVITATVCNINCSLYVGTYTLLSARWATKNPFTSSIDDLTYDFLDLVADTFSVPTGVATGYCSRVWTLRLPCPVIIGPGQALIATFSQSLDDPFLVGGVVPYIRCRFSYPDL
jgi:hypothetical protein